MGKGGSGRPRAGREEKGVACCVGHEKVVVLYVITMDDQFGSDGDKAGRQAGMPGIMMMMQNIEKSRLSEGSKTKMEGSRLFFCMLSWDGSKYICYSLTSSTVYRVAEVQWDPDVWMEEVKCRCGRRKDVCKKGKTL